MALNHVTLDDKYDLDQEPDFRHRLPGAGAPLPDAEGARPPRRPQHRGLRHRLSRLAARHPRPAVHPRAARSSTNTTSASRPGSTRTSPPPRSGARSRPSCAARASSMACSASGTARDRASTAPATSSATPISPAPRSHGGVLALMGDDHTAESSTTAHQSEYHFIDVMIPILNPAGVQEILDYGLYGWAMSRFCGTWVALKSMHETVESTAVIDGSLERVNIVIPHDFAMPEGGPQHPPARHGPRPGSAAARLQARCHARLRARQQAQQVHHLRRAQSEDRHHHRRQELSRRAPGARRARHRRGQVQRSRHPALQDRDARGRSAATTSSNSPMASSSSSWSRRSAR